jgi:hypothetical protein
MVRCLPGVILLAAAALAAPPAPSDYFGFEPGEDFKLADYSQIAGYFHRLDQESDRLMLREFGRSAHGRPMYVAFISSPENLAALDRYRDISRRLALGQADREEARRLAREGKAVVWIDSGLHSTEVAPAQHAPVLAYQMVTGEGDEIRRIRDRVILMQVPVINPDGHEMVVEWYRRNVGTPYELGPLPWPYHKYAGHDNNRDWFMLNLVETRHVSRLIFEEWLPQIVYNQHQQPAFPARIFVPPYDEPLNPHIPAAVMEGVHLIGSAMKERFARENKPGVLSYHGFDAWWNGGLRSAVAFHNLHGILTETAAGVYGTPRIDEAADLPKRFRHGLSALHPSVFYQRPWLGGRWGVKEAIDYMLTADFAILDLAAARSDHFLLKAYDLAMASIEEGRRGKPYAYVVPAEQWDRSSALDMLRRLDWAGVELYRAASGFEAAGKTYSAGAWVLPAAQPFRPYLVDLMEPQEYPSIRENPGESGERPYDVAGWTLRMSMGVAVDRIDQPFEARLERVGEVPAPGDTLDHRENQSFVTVRRLIERGRRVRWGPDGEILVKGQSPDDRFDSAPFELRLPRLALYEPYTANLDAGWTQWTLDRYEVPYTIVRNGEMREGRLHGRFDAVLLASQSWSSILHGVRPGEAAARRKPELDAKAQPRPEYAGGIGLEGLGELDRFIRRGGVLIAFDQAADLPILMFPLPLRNPARDGSGTRFACPGSLIFLRIDTSRPLGFGMPADTIGFCGSSRAFETTLLDSENKGERDVQVAARYAEHDLLASGWISGEQAVAGKPAVVEARHGAGRVILFAVRPQFRGQTFGTMKLLLNAIYLASARELK